MILQNFWSILFAILSSSAVTAIALMWIFITRPEKIERWISIIARGFAYFSERAARVHMATDIESAISEKRIKLGLKERGLSYGIKIKWTNVESIETDLKENKVVVMMRPFRSQSKNFAHVTSVYVSEALLPQSRKYVEPNLMKGIDHTISKSILEINPTALEYYVSDFMEQVPEEVKSWIIRMDQINEQGHLTRILISELQRLSALYPKEPYSQTYRETVEMAEEVHRFVTYGGPEIRGLGVYAGNNIKMAIVPVAKPESLIAGIQPHFEFIGKKLDEGIDHFYVVSVGRYIKFAKELVEKACSELKLSRVFTEEYKGIFRGKRREMFCSLLSFYHD